MRPRPSSQNLRPALDFAAEFALDADVTWGALRELFRTVVFEAAERRYGPAPQIAAALDTTVRTVRDARKRRRTEAPHQPACNSRRRVLRRLERGPATFEELRRVAPRTSDTDYTSAALRSLVDDGLVEHDDRLAQYRTASVPRDDGGIVLRIEVPASRVSDIKRLLRAEAFTVR